MATSATPATPATSTPVSSVTSNALSDLSNLGTLLKTDLLQAVGTPVLTLLQTLNTIAAEPISAASLVKAQGAWIVFTGNLMLSLPNIESQVLQSVIQWMITKVQSLAPAPAT